MLVDALILFLEFMTTPFVSLRLIFMLLEAKEIEKKFNLISKGMIYLQTHGNC